MILEVSWDSLWAMSLGLTISWSWLLACVRSGPYSFNYKVRGPYSVYLNKTPKHEWCMVRLGLRTKSNKNMCLKHISLRVHDS